MPLEILYIIGTVVVFGALVYGSLKSRSRNRANDPIREEAAKQLSEDPEAYEHGGKQKLDAQLKPEN